MNKPIVNILLAEDDLHLGILLVDFLETSNFNVKLCRDGVLALKAFQSNTYDLCLLDVMLPQLDGFVLANKIRKINKTIPIIFITARSLKEDKLLGYRIGADDYVTKPFDEEELLCKIRAILRRVPAPSKEPQTGIVGIGKYCFDFPNQSLNMGSDRKRLTAKESTILHYLWQHRNQVIKREQMLIDLWGENDYFLGRSLDVFISKMRKYLKADASLSIENVFGVGFIFNVPD